MLQEGDQSSRHRDELLRGNIHVIDLIRGDLIDVAAGLAHQDPIVLERAVRVEQSVCLGDDMVLFRRRSEVVDLGADFAVDHPPVRSLDEAVAVDLGVCGERADQADVGAFRGLDRAHPSVVRGVNVTNLEPGALARKAARAECREAASVSKTRQRIGLVHELAQLAGSEEFLDRSNHRTDIDQALWRDGLRILSRHPLPNHPLQAGEPYPDLVLNQLADRTHPAVGEVVDIVDAIAGGSDPQLHQVLDGRQHVIVAQQSVLVGVVLIEIDRLPAEFQVQLVTTNPGEVVPLGVVEEVVDEAAGRFDCGQLAGAQLAIQIEEGFVLGSCRVLLQRVGDELGSRTVAEEGEQLLVALPEAESAQECGDILPALAIYPDTDGVLLVDVELEPGTAPGDDLGGEDVLVRRLVDGEVEIDPW